MGSNQARPAPLEQDVFLLASELRPDDEVEVWSPAWQSRQPQNLGWWIITDREPHIGVINQRGQKIAVTILEGRSGKQRRWITIYEGHRMKTRARLR